MLIWPGINFPIASFLLLLSVIFTIAIIYFAIHLRKLEKLTSEETAELMNLEKMAQEEKAELDEIAGFETMEREDLTRFEEEIEELEVDTETIYLKRMVPDVYKLQNFVLLSLKKGLSPEFIKQKLMSKGWADSDLIDMIVEDMTKYLDYYKKVKKDGEMPEIPKLIVEKKFDSERPGRTDFKPERNLKFKKRDEEKETPKKPEVEKKKTEPKKVKTKKKKIKKKIKKKKIKKSKEDSALSQVEKEIAALEKELELSEETTLDEEDSDEGTPLTEINGIGKKTAEELMDELNITSSEELAKKSPEDVAKKTGMSEKRSIELIRKAKRITKKIPLTKIKGIGNKRAKVLKKKLNVNSVKDLIKKDPNEIAKITDLSLDQVKELIKEAKKLREKTPLTKINGVGSKTAEEIKDKTGITSIEELVLIKPSKLAEETGLSEERSKDIIAEGKKVMEHKFSKSKSKKSSARKKSKSKKSKPKKSKIVLTKKKGSRFHNPTCIVLKKYNKEDLVSFDSKEDALKKGYKPCSVCSVDVEE